MGDKNKRAGFSLIELIVVIAIMAVLVAILAPQLLKYVEKSREAVCQTNLDNAIESYKAALIDNDTDAANLDEKVLMDQVATGLGGTVVTSGVSYKGLCPSGGVTTLTIYVDGSISLTCGKHTNNSAEGFGTAILNALSTIKRANSDQTLKDYFTKSNTNYTKAIDSESNTSGSMTQAIQQALKDVIPTNQSWKLTYNGSQYLLYVMTGGIVTKDMAGTSVNCVKYVYDSSSGKLVTKTSVSVNVNVYNNAYARLMP